MTANQTVCTRCNEHHQVYQLKGTKNEDHNMPIIFGLNYGYMVLNLCIVVVHTRAQELYDGEEGGRSPSIPACPALSS